MQRENRPLDAGGCRHWNHWIIGPTARDWYGAPRLITPVDALDTLVVMGLADEANAARTLSDEWLSFDQDITVKNFEITIRVPGTAEIARWSVTCERSRFNRCGTQLTSRQDNPGQRGRR